MSLTVITGWSPSGWIQYGHEFLETFRRYWPTNVRLISYVEEFQAIDCEQRLLSEITGCMEFLKRNDQPLYRGRIPTPQWKERAVKAGYNYKYDAWKFSRQGFIPHHAALQMDDGLLCWLDADVVTHKPVPSGFIESLLPHGFDLAYLGRGAKHSEIGFQLYRVPQASFMLNAFSAYYREDRVFGLPEWHSAYVFDVARKSSGIQAHNLTPGGTGHVWFQSPLGRYLDHLKGDRKACGRSAERP